VKASLLIFDRANNIDWRATISVVSRLYID